ncbi:MAG: DUF3786 domain-containing protein [Desulfobacterales bacterium]|jgi:hypothetical protein|nr:DUF3786 domain-containing protein [Desulfobacterales bacterium]
MQKSSVFEETYNNYLAQIARLDLKKIADRLGAEMVGDELIIPVFGKPHRISPAGISGPSGSRPNFSVCVILFKYLLLCPDHEPVENDWVSFKDFKDSAPFSGAFVNYTEAPLAKYFSGHLKDLEAACRGIHGHPPVATFSYDLCMQFNALPKIPVLLLFNDTDDDFAAQCMVLYERRAEDYLDMECLAMVGMLLFEYLKPKTDKPA